MNAVDVKTSFDNYEWSSMPFVPYGFILWHGKKEQDKMKIHNGIAGIWAANFFMLGLFLLGYICRDR